MHKHINGKIFLFFFSLVAGQSRPHIFLKKLISSDSCGFLFIQFYDKHLYSGAYKMLYNDFIQFINIILENAYMYISFSECIWKKYGTFIKLRFIKLEKWIILI